MQNIGNFDKVTKESIKNHIPNWPEIPINYTEQ